MEKKKVKILFLEDSQDVYELNITELKKSGIKFQGIRVETKDEFIKQLNNNSWDIILSDYDLPGFNGFNAYDVVKKYDKNIPIIIVTGTLNEEVAVACIEKGIDNYVTKDNLTRLGTTIKQVLEKYKIEQLRKKTGGKLKQKVEESLMIGQELITIKDYLSKLNRNLDEKVQERTKELEKLLKNKDEFIGQLGHDLKTPISIIINLLPLIREDSTDPEIKYECDMVIRNVRYIKNLVTKTLQIANLSSPNVKCDYKELNLMELVNNVIIDNQLILEKQNIKIENQIKDEIIVNADELQLIEVFNNLINNAAKYSQEGKGCIILDVQKDKDMFIVSVKDTGIGMTKEQLEIVFDEFYKADSSRHNLGSTGLGLSIVKRIVEKHGGKIWVDSPGKNKGSIFSFTLPIGNKIDGGKK